MSTSKEAGNNDPGQESIKELSSTSDFLSDPKMHYIEAIGKWTYTSDDGVTFQFDEDQQQWTQIVFMFLLVILKGSNFRFCRNNMLNFLFHIG